jgi:ATP-dependent helicase HrpA
LHQAILTGFLSSIGQLDQRREYIGTRGTRFVIAPGTPLAQKTPRWVVAGSLVETTRLYARMVASVQPQWIEGAGSHLLKRNYSDPHWVQSQGFVAAYESITLYGLTLVARRRVSYGSVAPEEAREIFVREALVEGRMGSHPPFLSANLRLRAEVERMEAKIRRRDILVDEQTQAAFYLARIPERMSSASAFERWRAEAEGANPQLLFMTPADLMERDAPEASSGQFPDERMVQSNRLPLIYRFEPTAPDDGVTLVVPELLVELLDADRLAWLVPGLRLEKITATLRALPKAIRKQFVPVPDYAKSALDELTASVYADDSMPGVPSVGFSEWMARWITRYSGATISAQDIAALPMPDTLRLNYRVVDANDAVTAEGRDLAEIKRKFRLTNFQVSGRPVEPRAPLHREWDFGELRESTDVTRGRLRLLAYPAIEDRGAGVALVEARTAVEADALTRRAIVRLAMLALPQQAKALRKTIGEDRDLMLLSQGLALDKPLADALIERAFRECFLPDDAEPPRDRAEFEARLDARRSELHDVTERLMRRVKSLLKEWRAIRITVHELKSPIFASAVADIEAQLDHLLSVNFIETTPQKWFDEFPRYLKAIARRLERLPGNVDRDTELARRAGPFAQALRALESQPANIAGRVAVEQLRWMIEEFRVSLYAQDLRTVLPVSEKRLSEQLDRARAALRN